MSVGRLYLNLSSADITWKRLPSVPSVLLVSEDFKEEDGDDEQDEEDESLRCLRFFLQDLCLLGEEGFSVFLRCLLIDCLFLCLVALLPLCQLSLVPCWTP